MRLTPSPPLPGLIDWAGDDVSTNFMFVVLDHRERARRAAPITSLPGLMFGPGDVRELENATVIVFVGHLIWRGEAESVNSIVYGRTGEAIPSKIASIVNRERRITEIGEDKVNTGRGTPATRPQRRLCENAEYGMSVNSWERNATQYRTGSGSDRILALKFAIAFVP
jgi:hypothetical protein